MFRAGDPVRAPCRRTELAPPIWSIADMAPENGAAVGPSITCAAAVASTAVDAIIQGPRLKRPRVLERLLCIVEGHTPKTLEESAWTDLLRPLPLRLITDSFVGLTHATTAAMES